MVRRLQSARKQVLFREEVRLDEPGLYRVARLLRKLELDRPPGFTLQDQGTLDNVASLRNVTDPETD